MISLIESIEQYFEETKSYMEGLLAELDKQDEQNNQVKHVETVVWYYKGEIISNISKLEIHCRALRDKLDNG